MFDLLFGKDTDVYLLEQQSFSGDYRLITKSSFIMGEGNPPIHISSIVKINMEQTVDKRDISTIVSFQEITTETDNKQFEESLEEMQLFTTINPIIKFQRDMKGQTKGIANKDELWSGWEGWKKEQLPRLIPDTCKQQKVIKNYEKGLSSLEQSIDSNLQYTLLLPECYKFRDYPCAEDVSSLKKYNSRFIENLQINYRLGKQKFSIDNGLMKLSLVSQISREKDIIQNYLIPFYEKSLPDFSHEDYFMQICVDYLFDKNTSEIIMGKLLFTERLHANFTYKMELELVKSESKSVV